MNQYAAMAKVIATSDQHRALIAAHHDAWTRLRTIKTALHLAAAATHGNLDMEWMHRVEPMEERRGFPVDTDFAGAWRDALSSLEQDADAQLPSNIQPNPAG